MSAGSLEILRSGPGTTALGTLSLELRDGPYVARIADTQDEIDAALRLRFQVFNLELNEGLDSAFDTGLDADEFDHVCAHLIVQHLPSRQIVGTYRLQRGIVANANFGYYGEREFKFAPYERLRHELIELGRACIHREHRSGDVLYLLWRGIARYASAHACRYLIGCSSLTSQDPAHGLAAFERLRDWQVAEHLRTTPQDEFAIAGTTVEGATAEIPKLLRTYLAIGARVCGPPAIDREFKTIDFLTLLDLQDLHPRVRTRFLGRA